MPKPTESVPSDAQKWDRKYQGDAFFYGTQPNDYLRSALARYPLRGEVLSLGEGEGRNALFLAQSGLTVTALDQSSVGLHKAQRLLAQHGLALTPIVANLEDTALEDNRWDAIVLLWCHLPSAHRRPLHRSLARSLKPNGFVILECYRPEQIALGTGGPQSTDLLPTLEELREDFADLRLLDLAARTRDVLEGIGHHGTSAVLQCIAQKP